MGFIDKILALFSKPKAKALPPKAVHNKSAHRSKTVSQKIAPVKTTPKAEPAKEEAAPAASAAPIERRSHQRPNTHKDLRILIVDDSATIVAALRKMLRSAGCITREAMDAEKGLELVRLEQPDLVFLDIVLPGMNGFAALRLLRRDTLTQHIPVIMISGNEQATEEFYAKRIGADDFMKKPFSRSEVFGRIDKLIENNKLGCLKANVEAGVAEGVAKRKTDAGAVATPVPPQVSGYVESFTLPPQEFAPREAPKRTAPAAVSQPTLSSLEARTQLTAMGLQYFNQEQFAAAIERGDKLALQLFIAGGGINISEQFAENPV